MLNQLLPLRCCACSKAGNYICPRCYDQIDFISGPITIRARPIFLDSLTAAAHFTGPLRSLLFALKYEHLRKIGEYCGHFLYYHAVVKQVDCVSAVPLHEVRMRHRGYNQAKEIAVTYAYLTKLPYQDLLERPKNTRMQAQTLTQQNRQQNLEGAFSALPVAAGKQVLLIDDVATSGETLNQCARMLKIQGWEQVHALVVAHGH